MFHVVARKYPDEVRQRAALGSRGRVHDLGGTLKFIEDGSVFSEAGCGHEFGPGRPVGLGGRPPNGTRYLIAKALVARRSAMSAAFVWRHIRSILALLDTVGSPMAAVAGLASERMPIARPDYSCDRPDYSCDPPPGRAEPDFTYYRLAGMCLGAVVRRLLTDDRSVARSEGRRPHSDCTT